MKTDFVIPWPEVNVRLEHGEDERYKPLAIWRLVLQVDDGKTSREILTHIATVLFRNGLELPLLRAPMIFDTVRQSSVAGLALLDAAAKTQSRLDVDSVKAFQQTALGYVMKTLCEPGEPELVRRLARLSNAATLNPKPPQTNLLQLAIYYDCFSFETNKRGTRIIAPGRCTM